MSAVSVDQTCTDLYNQSSYMYDTTKIKVPNTFSQQSGQLHPGISFFDPNPL